MRKRTSKFLIPLLILNSTETVKDLLKAVLKIDKQKLQKMYKDSFRLANEIYHMKDIYCL